VLDTGAHGSTDSHANGSADRSTDSSANGCSDTGTDVRPCRLCLGQLVRILELLVDLWRRAQLSEQNDRTGAARWAAMR
jgi:hypothetical protein